MNPHPTPEEWMSFLYEEDSQADHRLRTEHLRQCAECRQEVERWHHSMQALDDWQLPAAAVPASAASLATACSTPEPVPARGQGRGAGRGVGRGAVPSLDGGFSFPPRMLAAAAAVALLATGASFGYFLPARHPDAAGLAAATKAYIDQQLAARQAELNVRMDQRQAELASTLRTEAAAAASEEARQLLANYAALVEDQRQADQRTYLTALRQLEDRRTSEMETLHTQLQTVAINADDGLNQAQRQLLELAAVAQTTPR